MKLAFVVRLGNDCRPFEGSFEGWGEEVDSCTERRFHSTGELLSFLGQCFEAATPIARESAISNEQQSPCEKKKSRRQKRLS